MQSGANVNANHIGSATALHHLIVISAQMGLTGLVIRDNKSIKPGQWDAARHEAIASYLVDAGANVDALDKAGKTPLLVAAFTGHAAAVMFLLKHGADISARDNQGSSALDWARWSATDDAIKQLAQAAGKPIRASGVQRRAQTVIQILKANGVQ